MKRGAPAAFCMMMAVALAGGIASRGAFAQQSSKPAQSAEQFPPDVHPETLNRMPAATKDELTSEEEKQAYDRVLTAEPRFTKPQSGGTGIRLHDPVVAENFRNAYNWLREKSGLDARYYELAVLTATRESNEEYEWLGHEKSSAKALPREVLEVIRNRKDTKGLDEKDALLIQFSRELYHQPKVSSKTFADMERVFGRKNTLTITLIMGYYTANALLMHAYDQQLEAERLGPSKTRPFANTLEKQAKN